MQINLANAATATPLLVAASVLTTGRQSVLLTGAAGLLERPINSLVNCLRNHGCTIDYIAKPGCLPLRVATTGLNGGTIDLTAADVTSHDVAALLLVAPYAKR